jgi:hypothetical protein
VGTASDQSVVAFVDLTNRHLENLHRAQSDACYHFLFPQEAGVGVAAFSGYSDRKVRDEMVHAIGDVVHSAVHSPQPLPDPATAESLLDPILVRLRDEYGSDLLLFKQKPLNTVGRQRVCTMTSSLYREVENLPQRHASLVLRYLLSNQKSATGAPGLSGAPSLTF